MHAEWKVGIIAYSGAMQTVDYELCWHFPKSINASTTLIEKRITNHSWIITTYKKSITEPIKITRRLYADYVCSNITRLYYLYETDIRINKSTTIAGSILNQSWPAAKFIEATLQLPDTTGNALSDMVCQFNSADGRTATRGAISSNTRRTRLPIPRRRKFSDHDRQMFCLPQQCKY